MEQGRLIANRYQIISKLGQGGMGAVWRVYDRLKDHEVALKQVAKSLSDIMLSSQGVLGRKKSALIQEFSLLASLRHPNIISVLDYGLANEKPFFTMELVNHPQNFIDVAQDKTQTEQIDLIMQILQALRYLHRRGVLHRDLKPDNVLIFDDNQLKVLDFGLSVKSELAEGRVGTMAYMSPESLKNNLTVPQSDLYAVGVMAYEMIVGERPFHPRDVRGIVTKPPDMNLLDNHPAKLVIERLLLKDPQDRYPDANACIEAFRHAMNLPAEVESITVRESYLQASTFVGRNKEFEILTDQFERVLLTGSTSFYLVGGESGVGKSRLLNELRIQGLVSGASVLHGQAVEGGGLPFQLWRNIVRRLLLMVDVTDAQAAILADIVPDMSLLIRRPVTKAPEIVGKTYQDRLVQTIVDLFRNVNQPVMLLLEDLQWAKESLAVLKQIVLVRDHLNHLMIVGNYRNDEAPHLSDELMGMKVIELNRLDRIAMQALTKSMIGQQGATEHVMDLLQKETEGNLFFLVETVRALAEESGGLEYVGKITLPDSVFTGGMQAITRRRLSKVDAQYSNLQTIAAIIGREIDMRLLIHAFDDATVQAWLRNAAEYGVVAIQHNTWHFAHDKLRETIIVDIPDDERPQTHRNVAEAIEAIYPDDDGYNEALLKHWQQVGERDKIYHYTLLVADHMLEIKGAYATVEALLQSLLGHLSLDDMRQVAILNRLAESVMRQGHYDASKTHAIRAQELAILHDDSYGLADSLHLLGVIANNQGDYERATDLHQQSLAIRQELGDQRTIANSLNNLGQIAFRQGDYERATDLYQQGLAIRQELGVQRAISISLNNLGEVAYRQGDYERATDLHQQSFAIRQELGDQHGIADSLRNLGEIVSKQGDYERATDLYQQSLVIRQELGDQSGIALVLSNLGVIANNQGDYERATDLYQQSLVIRQQLGDQRGISINLNNLGEIAYIQGDYDQATDLYQQSLAIRQQLGDQLGIADSLNNLGVIAMFQEDYERATDLYQQCLSIRHQLSDQNGISLVLNNLGIIAYYQGDYERATDLYQQSLKIRQKLGNQRGIAHSLLNLGEMAYIQGDYDHATELYQQSLKIMQQIGDQYGITAILNSLGRIAQKQGQTGQQQFYQSLTVAQDFQVITFILLNIIGFATYFIEQEHIEWAAQLVGLVQSHPTQDSHVRQYLEEILPQLEVVLSSDDLQVALQQGKDLDLDTVVQDLLDKFGVSEDDI